MFLFPVSHPSKLELTAAVGHGWEHQWCTRATWLALQPVVWRTMCSVT